MFLWLRYLINLLQVHVYNTGFTTSEHIQHEIVRARKMLGLSISLKTILHSYDIIIVCVLMATLTHNLTTNTCNVMYAIQLFLGFTTNEHVQHAIARAQILSSRPSLSPSDLFFVVPPFYLDLFL